MKPNPPNGRAGVSLIELLLAITFSSVVMVMAVNLIHRAMVYHTATQKRVEQASTFNRFAEQFRSDVHLATQAEPATNGLTLINQAGERATYSAKGHRLLCERVSQQSRRIEQVELAVEQTASVACSPVTTLCWLEIQSTIQDNDQRTMRRIAAALGMNCDSLQTDNLPTEEKP